MRFRTFFPTKMVVCFINFIHLMTWVDLSNIRVTCYPLNNYYTTYLTFAKKVTWHWKFAILINCQRERQLRTDPNSPVSMNRTSFWQIVGIQANLISTASFLERRLTSIITEEKGNDFFGGDSFCVYRNISRFPLYLKLQKCNFIKYPLLGNDTFLGWSNNIVTKHPNGAEDRHNKTQFNYVDKNLIITTP